MAIDPYKQRTSPTSARLPAAAVRPNISGYGNGLRALAGGIANVGAALEQRDAILKQRQDAIDEDNERSSMIDELPGLAEQQMQLREKIAASVGPTGAGFAEQYRVGVAELMDGFRDRAKSDVGLRLRRDYAGRAELSAVEEAHNQETQMRQGYTADLYEKQFQTAGLAAMGNPEEGRRQLEVLVANLDATTGESLSPQAKSRLLQMRSWVAANAVSGMIQDDPIKAKKNLDALVAGEPIKENAWAYQMLDVDTVHKMRDEADREVEVVQREALEQRASSLGSFYAGQPPEIAAEGMLGIKDNDLRAKTIAVYNQVTSVRERAEADGKRARYEALLDKIAEFQMSGKAGDANAVAAMRTEVTRAVPDPSDRLQFMSKLESPPRSSSDPRVRQRLIDLQLTNPTVFRDMDLLTVVGQLSDGDLKVFQNAQAEIRRTGISPAVRTPEVNRQLKSAFKQLYGYEVDSDAASLTPEQRARQGQYLEAVNAALMAAQPAIVAGKQKPKDVIDSVAASVRPSTPIDADLGVMGALGYTPRRAVGTTSGEPTPLYQVPRGTPFTLKAADIPADTYASLRRVLTRNGRKTTDAEIVAKYKAYLEETRGAR